MRPDASARVLGGGGPPMELRRVLKILIFRVSDSFFRPTGLPLGLAAPHRSSPVRRSGAKGRAQRRQEASRVPGMAAGRHGIDPRSISEVLKILIFSSFRLIFLAQPVPHSDSPHLIGAARPEGPPPPRDARRGVRTRPRCRGSPRNDAESIRNRFLKF